jgi:hypothetical protein
MCHLQLRSWIRTSESLSSLLLGVYSSSDELVSLPLLLFNEGQRGLVDGVLYESLSFSFSESESSESSEPDIQLSIDTFPDSVLEVDEGVDVSDLCFLCP